ncbi:hypothetical protein LX64_04967 [Chitinophaga skermanii]|uniref:Uncharacterized protein n=1 Tax=Chitinophaga skermanii TaxID=331697 RepID=A0A327Q1B2_9BACT|nr:hypothetical protein LX64_04967 [Chitinophaga skermanii]
MKAGFCSQLDNWFIHIHLASKKGYYEKITFFFLIFEQQT